MAPNCEVNHIWRLGYLTEMWPKVSEKGSLKVMRSRLLAGSSTTYTSPDSATSQVCSEISRISHLVRFVYWKELSRSHTSAIVHPIPRTGKSLAITVCKQVFTVLSLLIGITYIYRCIRMSSSSSFADTFHGL